MRDNDDLLWVEQFRPKTIKDCILPERLKKPFQDIIASGDMTNMLLWGRGGTGKTTIARALCNEMGYDYQQINASSDNGINMIRDIPNFAGVQSLISEKKAIILDEADNLTLAGQQAFRGMVELFPRCRFILTCNFPNKIIEPIRSSRMQMTEMNILASEKPDMMARMLRRVFDILDEKKISLGTNDEDILRSKRAIAEVVKKCYPDNRRIIGTLQQYTKAGVVDASILSALATIDVDKLLDAIKQKDFVKAENWILENEDTDVATLFRQIYDGFRDSLKPESVPGFIIMTNEYSDKATRAMWQPLNLAAFSLQMMQDLEFK